MLERYIEELGNNLILNNRAECYELTGDIRMAIKCIEKFINNIPDNLLIVKKCAKVTQSDNFSVFIVEFSCILRSIRQIRA